MNRPYNRADLLNFHPDRKFTDPHYSNREEQMVTPYGSQLSSFGKFTAGAGLVGYGAHKVASAAGINLFDPIYAGVRTVEELSPGRVFRTFQAGNFLSQFTTRGRADLHIAPEAIRADSEWFRDLVYRTGGKATSASRQGLRFSNGRLMLAESGDVLLNNATKMLNVGNPYLAAAYSRSLGFRGLPNTDSPNSLRMALPILEGVDAEQSVYFAGAATRKQAIANQAKAFITESAFERVNRLADAPFGVEPFSTGLGRVRRLWEGTIGTKFTLAVRSGSAPQMLGRMATKWGAISTVATLGYLAADKFTRDAGVLDSTMFREGITAGVAGLGIKANLAAAKMADMVPGARAYQRTQEEIAPGSTSLTKLLAFPASGLLAGGTLHYGAGLAQKAGYTRELMSKGISYTDALINSEKMLEASRAIPIKSLRGLTRGKAMALGGLALGTAAILPFLPGALMPGKTEAELEEIYSGRQEVAVRKSRFWELGKTPYEGTKALYYRPHWYPRMMQRGYEASVHSGNAPNPVWKWIKENFTYDMERAHYEDRPYPITGAAFEDVPIVGPALAATIGKLVKPQLLMHTNEWQGPDGSAIHQPGRLGSGPGDGGVPITPGFKESLGEQAYRLTELSGLTGFVFGSFKKAITGEEEFFDQQTRLQSARDIYSTRRSFWDKSMGGAVFTNEFIRRLYPNERKQISEYNPIRNLMPDWLPGPSDRSPDFLHGDPFTLVPEGEMRLPGAGYATRFPGLEGVDPADYPLIHKYKILTDIAPYSEKTKMIAAQVGGLARSGGLSDEDLAIYMQTKGQQPSRSENKKFYDFDITEGTTSIELPTSLGINQSRSTIAAINLTLGLKDKPRSLLGGYWEAIVKGIQSPLESLTPLAPASKLLNMKSAMHDYRETQVFGPNMALWQTPIKSFIEPFFRETGALLGADAVPEQVQRKREIEEYFDALKFVKNKRLAAASSAEGVDEAAGAYSRAARETMIGIDPYTRDYKALFRSIPRNERDYFGAFVGADTTEEREDILAMVPNSMRRIYSAQWEQRYIDLLSSEVEHGTVSAEEADPILKAFWDKRSTQGFEVTQDYIQQYNRRSDQEETYSSWYKENVLLPAAVAEEGLPGPDWVGFHPTVDLDEVKLRVVQNEAMNIHDFNLWLSDKKTAAQDPYLEQAASDLVSMIEHNEDRSPQQIQSEVRSLLDELGINGEVFSYNVEDETYRLIDIDTVDDRNRINTLVRKRQEDLG